MAAGLFRFRYRLRTLFFALTIACVGAWMGRILWFQQQAEFHHSQVVKRVQESEKMFLAGRPFSRQHWEAVRQQLTLACAYDHASCHPWMTLADARVQVQRDRLAD